MENRQIQYTKQQKNKTKQNKNKNKKMQRFRADKTPSSSSETKSDWIF